MTSWMGIGNTLYGKREKSPDGSYITTEWVIIFFIPIAPVASYRVWRGETKSSLSLIGVGASTRYQMQKVELNRTQVRHTYLVALVIVVLLVLFFKYAS